MAEHQAPATPLLVALDAALDLPPFFASFPSQTLATFLPTLNFWRYVEGEAIVREGEKGSDFFILLQGSASVRKRRGPTEEQEVARLGPGDSFGEVSLLATSARTATIVASENCLLASLSSHDLQKVMEREPELAERLEEQARKRISETSRGKPA